MEPDNQNLTGPESQNLPPKTNEPQLIGEIIENKDRPSIDRHLQALPPKKKHPGNPNIAKLAKIGGLAKREAKHKTTLAKERVWEEHIQKMMGGLPAVGTAHLIEALGSVIIYRIDKEKIGKRVIRKIPVRVTQDWEIDDFVQKLVNGELNETDSDSFEAPYYYVTKKDPNIIAIKDIYDRINGKPTQETRLTGKDGENLPIPILGGLMQVEIDRTNQSNKT